MKAIRVTTLLLVIAFLFCPPGSVATAESDPIPKNIAPAVWRQLSMAGEATFLVVLREQADLSAASGLSTRQARGRFVVDELRAVAQRTQRRLRALLDRRGISYRSFYIVNTVAVTGDANLVRELASRPEVQRIAANPEIAMKLPSPAPVAISQASAGVEWNVQRVNADDAWALGYTGQGVVVAGQDTGYDWDHPALISSYRGWDGITATHDYNWHDAIHTNRTYNSCGTDATVPCDDDGHGTHTMGTIVGDDGDSHQIGVAPGATWIGCRNMDDGWGTPATYIECFEFFLAPYPVGGDPMTDGLSELAPHVISNSWTCPDEEGCDWGTLQQAVENTRAAGILVAAAASNYGSGCSTINEPIAIYDAAFTVGATNSSNNIASFSSRGPVTVDGSGRPKPDVSAPGVNIVSSIRNGGYGLMSGTSMATPHVAGVAALLWSARTCLIGDVERTEEIIAHSAYPRTTAQGCGGDSSTQVPNNVYGWGIVDALAAVLSTSTAPTITKQVTFVGSTYSGLLEYTITASNFTTETLPGVVLTDTLPSGTVLAQASGVYTETGETVTWAPASVGGCSQLTATLVVTTTHLPAGTIVVNELYGLRVGGIVTPTLGRAVTTTIPYLLYISWVTRDWGG